MLLSIFNGENVIVDLSIDDKTVFAPTWDIKVAKSVDF